MPLRRHPALLSLSRGHHGALQLARGVQDGVSPHLRETLPAEPRALAAHVCRVFAETLAPHFDAEEAVVLVAARGHGAELDAECEIVEGEHARLRAMIAELSAPTLADDAIEPLLDRFGQLLEAHVRREERSLYEGVQAALDEPALAALGAKLEATSTGGS